MAEPARNFEPEKQPEKNFWQPEVSQGEGDSDGQPTGQLTPVENLPQNESDNPIDEKYANKFDPTKNSSSNSETDLEKLEKKPDSQEGNINQDEKNGLAGAGGLYDAGGDTGGTSRIKGAIQGALSGKKKYGWIGGGVAGLIISLMATFMLTFSPVHIMKNYIDHNFAFNDSFRRSRTIRIIDTVFNLNKFKPSGSKSPFVTKAERLAFERFETRMFKRGWSFTYDPATGKAIGLVDPAGEIKDLKNLSSKELKSVVQPMVDEVLPAWRMKQRILTRKWITTATGPLRSYKWSDLWERIKKQGSTDEAFQIEKFKDETGVDDIDSLKKPDMSAKKNTVDKDGNPIVADADKPPEGLVGEEGIDAVLNAKANGATNAEAIEIGKATIKNRMPGAKSIITAGVIIGCISYESYKQDLIGKFERYASAMRIGAEFLKLTNGIQDGDVENASNVGRLFSEYNGTVSEKVLDGDGNEILDANGNPTYKTVDKTFAASAAWQRATGEKPVGPELNEELHIINAPGSNNPAETILYGIGGFISGNMPLFSWVCRAASSAIGQVFGYLVDVVTIAFQCIGGVGFGCAAAIGQAAGFEAFFRFALPRLLSAALTNVVGFLVADPVQMGNLLDQSLSLISSEESRTATPVNSATYNTAVAKYFQEENKSKSFAQRYLDMDNANSFVARITLLKMDLSSMNPTQFFASLFNFPANSLVAVATTGNVFAKTDVEFDNYNIQKYSYDNEFMDSDPYVLAEEVSDIIEQDIELVNSEGDVDKSPNLARDYAVLCMGYDPASGEVNKGFGSPMLPQFSDPDPEAFGEKEATRRNKLFQKLCLEKPMSSTAQSKLYSKIGRYVDDIELLSSMVNLSEEVDN